jgi:hypothetical protein
MLAASAHAASADVTLFAPRAGEQLEGGRDATLTWSASSLPAHAEEWEAFLSVDGGAYYAVRITPHLDAAARTFRWHVPNVAASHARLLLRVGDERHEELIELPQTFTIVPRYAALDLAYSATDEEGEAAIEGGQPSVEWVSSDLVRHRRRDTAASGLPSIDATSPSEAAVVTSSRIALPADETDGDLTLTRSRPPRVEACAAVRPLLLLTTRLNV